MVLWLLLYASVFDRRINPAYPTFDAVGAAWEPVLGSLELEGRHYYAGSSHDIPVYIVNDSALSEDLHNVSFTWKLRN